MLCGKVNYKNLNIYEQAHELVLCMYKFTKEFPQHEHNNLTSQLRRATTSLPLNIAEGSGCMSFKQFLNFASFSYRSGLEVQACLRLAKDLNYVSIDRFNNANDKVDKFLRCMYKYLKYLEGKANYKKVF